MVFKTRKLIGSDHAEGSGQEGTALQGQPWQQGQGLEASDPGQFKTQNQKHKATA